MDRDFNYYLTKINRSAAWALFIIMILFFISGYGLTKGIIDPAWAKMIHLDYLPLVILVVFVLHASIAIRLSLIRWRVWNLYTKAFWALFFITFFSYFVYVDLFYQKPTAKAPDNLVNIQPVVVGQNLPTEKVFTKEELVTYDGQNGRPAYAAVDGVVYDFSRLFIDGKHFYHLAGQDLTSQFHSQHSSEQLKNYPIVGRLK